MRSNCMGTNSLADTTAQHKQNAMDSLPICKGTPEDMVLLDAGLAALQAKRDWLQ